MSTAAASSSRPPRQNPLPLSKAVEVAYQNIRLRLSRSVMVTTGIILALAFLMSILTSDAMIGAMRDWSRGIVAQGTTSPKLLAAQKLQAMLTAAGVPTTAAEIEGARLQHRWLIGIALLVAFIGILNSMLMSVTERFREIGTMKCLGALDGFIIQLFLVESLFQGIVGTALGILLGFTISIASVWSTYGSFVWNDFPAGNIARAMGICLAIGIGITVIAAVYPAWQAARMHPIEAMRSET